MKRTYFLLEGEEKAIELLAQLLDRIEHVNISKDRRGEYWFSAAVFHGLSEGQAYAATESFLDIASGLMRLWAGTPGPVRAKGVLHVDSETGEGKRFPFELFKLVPQFRPNNLLIAAEGGLPLGTVLLVKAEYHSQLATALSVMADGGEEWWQIYILLEILRDHYGSRPNKRRGDWERAFKELRQVYGVSRDRLEALRRTADYHRHAAKEPPPKPWPRGEAAGFVHQAIRDWIGAVTGIAEPESGPTDSSGASVPSE